MTELSERPPLTSKLEQMKRRPFGVTNSNSRISEINGTVLTASIKYMLEVIDRQMEESLPAGIDSVEKEAAMESARNEALARLVTMLNAAIPDKRFHVTPTYIMDTSNNYTVEFWLFTVDYCRVISGDEDFFDNYSNRRVPPVIAALLRPLAVSTTCRLLPQIVRRFSSADVRAVEITPTSAVMRWHAILQPDPVLREVHLTISSRTLVNYFAAIPTLHNQPPATVTERLSMLDGAEYFEWEFTWRNKPRRHNRWIIVGLLAAVALIALQLTVGIPTQVLLALMVFGMLLLGFSIDRFNRIEDEQGQRESLLQEQRVLAEEQFVESQEAKAKLQNLNIELARNVDEFRALYDIGVAVNATLDPDELIQRSLEAVTDHLHYDRAMVMLVDEERGVLTHGRGVGDVKEIVALVSGFQFSLDDKENHFIKVLNADEPILIEAVDPEGEAVNVQMAKLLGVKQHLGTPLISKGRRLGILSVDNGPSGRPIVKEEIDLLGVVGGQIAVAIDNALLYQEVEAQKRTLEQRVERRTRDLALATTEAQEARAIAEQANEAKSAFLSNVSHELRTPLTSVLGFTKVIQKAFNRRILPNVNVADDRVERASRNIQENLDIIIQEGERLTALINDVLDLAKIEAGKVQWELETLRIESLFDRALAATSSLFEENKLQLVREIDEDLPMFVGDRDKVIQVLINLLSNAVKFTEEGAITCRVRLEGEQILVSVSDTGIGIPEGDLQGIFDMFKQSNDAPSSKAKGTGLGLAICREIIQSHGGRIWAESEIGVGSTISFNLPTYYSQTADPPTVDLEQLLAHLGAPPAAAKERATILIVDDDEAVRKYLVQEITSAGYEVIEAASGVEALEVVSEAPPDLLIMDVLMLRMDGFSTLAAIRSDPAMMTTPAVFVSVTEDRSHGYGLGIDTFMCKPIDADVLLASVKQALAMKPAGRTVVVADDDQATAEQLAQALHSAGHQVQRIEALPHKSGDLAADIVLVNAAQLAKENPFERSVYRKGLIDKLVLAYNQAG